MPSQADCVALAIRAGIIPTLSKSNSSNSSDYVSEGLDMAKVAQEHMAKYVTMGPAAEVSSLLVSNSTLIEAAVKGVVLAYQGISNQVATLNEQRKKFEEELQLDIAFFTIPGHLESMDLSKEEQAVVGFFDKLIDKYPLLFAYSGIKLVRNEDDPRTKRYCALPLYAMNQLKHPIASPRALDEARIAINLLFHSKAIQSMQLMADDFRTDSKFIAFFSSTYQQENYLNKLRAPRLILIALFNILWSIQHPIDSETGYCLTMNENIKICADFKNLINRYLADKTLAGPYTINSNDNNLVRMIKHVEIRANALHVGFILEKLRQFNLKDLTNSAHRALRGLDTSLFKLLFTKINPVTKSRYPNKLAAADIADTMSLLNELINKNPIFLLKFDEERNHIPDSFLAQTYINPKVRTVIDVLIVFCHLTQSQRDTLIKTLRACPDAGEDGDLMAWELEKFSKNYIGPLEKVNLHVLKNTSNSSLLQKVPKLTASRLIPLVTLAVADFRTAVDANQIEKKDEQQSDSIYCFGKEQVQLINDAAQVNSSSPPKIELGDYPYHWLLSPYLPRLTSAAALSLDSLPCKQYRMTQITELLDCISELTQNYRSFLQFKSFQAFLMECLQYVDDAYRQFAKDTQLAEHYLSVDGLVDRTLKDVFMDMVDALKDNLIIFRQSLDDITHIVGAPNFTELRKHELTKQVNEIEQKFTKIFNKEPVNFINTYQRILSQVDMAPIRAEKIKKTKQLYEFSKKFFIETQKTLTDHLPQRPPAPHFLNQLKTDKLKKYLTIIDLSIKHIGGLIIDENFSVDTYEFFRQLQLIDEDAQLRKEDKIKDSTYCKVIIGELKTRFTQQDSSMDVGLFSVSTPHRRAVASHLSVTNLSLYPMPLLTLPSPSIRDCAPRVEESDVRNVSNSLLQLKKDFQKVLEDYISIKIQERPTHWFFKILQIFKQLFGQLFHVIRERQLETKIKVAQKVIGELKKSAKEASQTLVLDLKLSPSETKTLKHGSLGNQTLFFRNKLLGDNPQMDVALIH